MKSKILFFTFLICFWGIYALAQPILVKKTQEIYTPDLGSWTIDEQTIHTYSDDELIKTSFEKFRFLDGNLFREIEEINEYEDGNIVYDAINYYDSDGYNYAFESTATLYEDGKIVQENMSHFYPHIDSTIYRQIFYDYDGEQLVSKRHYSLYTEGTPTQDDWYQTESFQYNANGCQTFVEVEHEYWFYSSKRIDIRDENCALISSIYYRKIPNSDEFIENKKYSYARELVNDHLITRDSTFNPNINIVTQEFTGWELFSVVEREWDERGNMIRWQMEGSYPFEKNIMEYDDQNRLTSLANYVLFSGDEYELFALQENKYIELYDEKNFLTELTTEQHFMYEFSDYLVTQEQKFTNFCDGTHAMESLKTSENLDNLRIFYEYLNGIDCDDEPQQQPILVQPNPTSGLITIKSPALSGSSTKVKVINWLGQTIYEEKLPQQSYLYQLDLSHLSNGNYVLYIDNGSNYSVETVSVWR